jgi:hypothetical protein
VPVLSEPTFDLREILFGVVVPMRSVLELVHELAKQLADERPVFCGGVSDHGVRWERSR